MEMTEYLANDCCTRLISKKINHGDFDFFYVIDLRFEDSDATNDKCYMQILAVSPESAEKICRKELLDCYEENFDDATDEQKVDALVEYGCFAMLFSKSGEEKELLVEAGQKLSEIDLLFGFYMDKYQNRIGSTGWDFIKGDVLAGSRV